MQKETILVADDSDIRREILVEPLKDKYNILQAADGVETLRLLGEHIGDISLLMLDMSMPRMNGLEVLKTMNNNDWIKRFPTIIISADTAGKYIYEAYRLGAIDYVSFPFQKGPLFKRVDKAIRVHKKQKRLEEIFSAQLLERGRTGKIMTTILSHIVESRNGEMSDHVIHLRGVTKLILEELAATTDRYKLPKEYINIVASAATLHDIGKISVPESILSKNGPLTPEETSIVRTHPMAGAEILKSLPVDQNEDFLRIAYEICRWHHERWDGKGYPDHLKADETPISAQVVAIVDAYDSLVGKRSYKESLHHDVALDMIKHGECGIFNPLILKALEKRHEEIKQFYFAPKFSNGLYSNDELVSAMQGLDVVETELEKSFHTLKTLEETADFLFDTPIPSFSYFLEIDRLSLNPMAAEMLDLPHRELHSQRNKMLIERFGLEWLREFRHFWTHSKEDEFTYKSCPTVSGKSLPVVFKGKIIKDSRNENIGLVGRIYKEEDVN